MIELIRTETSEEGTYGILKVGEFNCFTLEEPWKNNAKSKSCIPCGEYFLRRSIYYKRNYECFEIEDVPNRSRILIHVGNTLKDTEGCVLPGLKKGEIAGERAVLFSRKAFNKFMACLTEEDEYPFIVESDCDEKFEYEQELPLL